jgi:hypothetical protein
MMARHTPPRPVDVESRFPELALHRKAAVRLHPRIGNPQPSESSIGGPLLWPAREPWPYCYGEHITDEGEGGIEGGPVPNVAVLQIYKRDAQSISFPEGSDLLQLLWCPFLENRCSTPTPKVFWRNCESIQEIMNPSPVPSAEIRVKSIPNPTILHPEEVVEYPSWDIPDRLKESLLPKFRVLQQETGWRYSQHLSEAPGSKVGGYPDWSQGPAWPDCGGCGRVMQYLLTVSSWEYDGESWRTWLPIEERGNATGRESIAPVTALPAHHAAGLRLGDAGSVNIFECTDCPGRPVGYRFDG